MRAMVLPAPHAPLVLEDRGRAALGPRELRLRVEACAVCRTDLHLCDGELPQATYPIVPGHEIVGTVLEAGSTTSLYAPGDRVGVPWLAWACGVCEACTTGHENLCDHARFTGCHVDGGFAEEATVDERFALRLSERDDAVATAPLLCAGLIGYRSLRMAGDPRALGIYGFGAAAHIVAQIARWEGRDVYAFTRSGDAEAQRFALSLGCAWAGSSDDAPPAPLDAAILFAPVGSLVPRALGHVKKGGTVVCGGIHMSDIPSFPYSLLWGERVLRSVANLTRADGTAFLDIAKKASIRTETHTVRLDQANDALARLRSGHLTGAIVLQP